jgi:hypothetical protein
VGEVDGWQSLVEPRRASPLGYKPSIPLGVYEFEPTQPRRSNHAASHAADDDDPQWCCHTRTYAGSDRRGRKDQSFISDTLGGMCRKVKCSKCQLATWAGCGAHVEQVLGGIPQSQRCQGHVDQESAAALGGVRSWFLKLLSR